MVTAQAHGPNPPDRISLRGAAIVAGYAGVIVLALWGALRVWEALSFVLLPFFIAVLLVALAEPLTGRLRRAGLPSAAASIATVLIAIAFMALLFIWIAPGIYAQVVKIADEVGAGAGRLPNLLHDIGIKNAQLQDTTQTIVHELQTKIGTISSTIGGGFVAVASTLLGVIAGAVLTLMLVIYLLIDGAGFWRGFLKFAPAGRRQGWLEAGERSWHVLKVFVRTQVLVAAMDGIGIGIGLWIIGVPLAFPLGVLTFLFSLVPYVGAISAGAIAALVALASNGVSGLLWTLVIVTAVHQLEGNVLYPVLVGRSVRLHPVAVLLAVGIGVSTLGIVGGFIATPTVAVIAAAAGWLELEQTPVQDQDAGAPPPEPEPGAPPPAIRS